MIPSGNAAAVVFAEHISGTEEEFVKRMNETAVELGMYAEFTNSHGAFIHYTNAYSMAILVREFITRYPDILRITSMRNVTFQGTTHRGTNLLIVNNMMPDVDGFKTGTLRQAGWNHSTTAERDGRRIIAVVMNTSTSMARQTESRALLNFGFEELERREKERAERVRVFHDGELIPLSTTPRFYRGNLLLPTQDILSHLGYNTWWNKEHRLVALTHRNGYRATIFIDREIAVINGSTYRLPMPAQVIDGRLHTSVGSLGMLTGTFAEWSTETGVVRLRNK